MSVLDPVHLHLMLNHIPVLGSVFALILLGIGFLAGRDYLQKLGLAVIVVVALLALPVFFTGEPTEKAVEHLSGVVESAIDAHQDSATLAFASVLVTGVIGVGGLFISHRGRRLPRVAAMIAFIACLTTVVLMARTANLGGNIRHSEISAARSTAVEPQQRESHHEDDD